MVPVLVWLSSERAPAALLLSVAVWHAGLSPSSAGEAASPPNSSVKIR